MPPGFPLLIKSQFPGVNPLAYAWLGPLVGAVVRPFGGWLADKLGGARVTLLELHRDGAGAWSACCTSCRTARLAGSFTGFFLSFLVLFLTTGIGNGSTFRMIPVIFLNEALREVDQADAARPGARATKEGNTEGAATLGFTAAIAAYGGFFIPKSYGTSIAMTGGPEAALYVFIVFYLMCIAVTWWYYARAQRAHALLKLSESQRHEPLSRPTHLLLAAQGVVLRRPRRDHRRRPHLGRRLPQPLGARQDRAQHPRRELHRLLLLEDLRQGRHRHLGNPADRLPAHALGHAQPRAARLRARRQLQLVPVQRQPREVPDGARPPARSVWRDARRSARTRSPPGPRSSTTPTRAATTSRCAAWAASCVAAGTRSTRSSPPPTSTPSSSTGPDRIIGFSPIPAMCMVSYAAGSRYLSLIGGVCMSFYDWYCDLPPASPQVWGEQTDVPESADWYNSSFIIAWGSNVPQTRTPDAHFFTEVRYKGTKTVAITPDYSEVAKLADLWLHPKQGTDAALAMAMGHVILKEFYFDKRSRLLRRLRAPLHRPADAGDAEGAHTASGETVMVPDRYVRASDFNGKLGQANNPEWKTVAFDDDGKVVLPNGAIGFRWGAGRPPRRGPVEPGRQGSARRPAGQAQAVGARRRRAGHETARIGFPYFGGIATPHFTTNAQGGDVLVRTVPVLRISLGKDGEER